VRPHAQRAAEAVAHPYNPTADIGGGTDAAILLVHDDVGVPW
jgi:hypothetical protein